MKTKLIQIIGIMMILFLVSGVSSQGPPGDVPQVREGSDNVELETDAMILRIVGGQNVPFYSFWDVDDDSTKYMVSFSSIFEADDSNDNGVYDLGEDTRHTQTNVALPSLSWNFSDVSEDDDGSLHFNMTSSDGTFQLRNHLFADEDSQLKFDVVIDGYSFTNSDAILVMGFKVTVQGGDDTTEQNGDTANFGDGFFQIEDTAEDETGTIDVGLSSASDEGQSKLYMAYGHFSGRLEHDPTVGLKSSESGATDQITEVFPRYISKGALAFATIIATVVAISIPVLLFRSKR